MNEPHKHVEEDPSLIPRHPQLYEIDQRYTHDAYTTGGVPVDDRQPKDLHHPDSIHLTHSIHAQAPEYFTDQSAMHQYSIPNPMYTPFYNSMHGQEPVPLQHYPPDMMMPHMGHISHEPLAPYPDSTPTTKGQRKSRWRPTPKQKEKLEAFWHENQYPDRNAKHRIAQELDGVTSEQVSRWFKHRRESFVQKGKFQYRNEAATKFSNDQVALLENVFKANAYPSRDEIKSVADQMLVSQQRVKNWFKARRCRLALKGEFEFKQNSTLTRTPSTERKRSRDSPLLDDNMPKRIALSSYREGEEDGVGLDDPNNDIHGGHITSLNHHMVHMQEQHHHHHHHTEVPPHMNQLPPVHVHDDGNPDTSDGLLPQHLHHLHPSSSHHHMNHHHMSMHHSHTLPQHLSHTHSLPHSLPHPHSLSPHMVPHHHHHQHMSHHMPQVHEVDVSGSLQGSLVDHILQPKSEHELHYDSSDPGLPILHHVEHTGLHVPQ
eukprot:TRINITY_DN3582_c0_g1_i4.p1 TRINITY_DN3582_c0_g1~~TRINITY_DN3582_c0_g1_i4.p1  ORF type:complete len:487 (+),score=74.04 TRINITY_DN3582_c0_g1_i4:50-1510(+)